METGVVNPNEVCQCVRVSEYATAFFGYAEYFQRMVLEHEKKSGKRSHGICIFGSTPMFYQCYINLVAFIPDMAQMSMIKYGNPLSSINKMFQVCVLAGVLPLI